MPENLRLWLNDNADVVFSSHYSTTWEVLRLEDGLRLHLQYYVTTPHCKESFIVTIGNTALRQIQCLPRLEQLIEALT